ncbi:MAG: Stf0 family sulfotransferase [Alteraurantiacibacter sp.]
MIEGITTGYEARFDFPVQPQGPRAAYLLASLPRAGSTWLSHQLWASGCLGAPLEYLNFEPGGPYGHAAEQPDEQARLWRQALATRTSPNGVFGLKSFPGQLHHVQQSNPALVAQAVRFLLGPGSACKVVELRRRNRQAHAVSYARALLSGVWRAEQEQQGRGEPAFSAEAVDRAGRMLDQQHDGWQAMYRDLGITPLVMWFEDALSDPAGAVQQVADYLGIALDPAARVDVPGITQQAQEGARDWVRRLGEAS